MVRCAAVSRNVKGVLFADYVRMMRAQKKVDWASELEPEDVQYLLAKVDPKGWYPMETFERMGDAILRNVAGGSVEAVRMWGRYSVDQLRSASPELVVDGDPVDTLMRFRVLRATFFDFEAIEVTGLSDGEATIVIHYHMGATAEEAASFQTLGFFERLLDVAGGKDVEARFTERSWAGDPRTVLTLVWS